MESMAHGVTPVVVDCPGGPKDIVGKNMDILLNKLRKALLKKLKLQDESIPKSLLKSRSNDYSADTISLDYIRPNQRLDIRSPKVI